MPIARLTCRVGVTLLVAAAFTTTISASHSWGSYHWARTENPFTLTVVDSTTSEWDGYVEAVIDDWSGSAVLDMTQVIAPASSKDRRQCKAPSGQIRVCNLAYGQTGWIGLAGISIDGSGHIFTGYTKLNDSYFSQSFYNTPAWRQSVTCQELGHDLGLDHQDENFYNNSLFSCMDYQSPPYEYANAHDFEQLANIYAHTDSYNSYTTSGGSGSGGGGGGCTAPPGKGCNKGSVGHGNTPNEWGISLGRRGQRETFIRIEPDGTRHLTFVTWAERR